MNCMTDVYHVLAVGGKGTAGHVSKSGSTRILVDARRGCSHRCQV